MKLKLSNSIYSKGGMLGDGLDVQGGRLINNRPDGMTGIAQAAVARSAMKRMEKVAMTAEGVYLGNMKTEMGEM